MKKDAYTKGVLTVTDGEVTDSFKLYLKTKAGYIRRLDERDQYHKDYEASLYGFFTSEGKLIAAREDEGSIFIRAIQFGHDPHYVH